MAQIVGAGPKSRSSSGLSGNALNFVEKNIVPVSQNRQLSSDFLSQISEALRTGGVGAQIPIIQQAVSQTNQATSDALRATQGSLASSGLSRTPYGQNILAGQRLSGAQAAARIPTDAAQQFIGMGPQFSQGLLTDVLGAIHRSVARSGPYNT